MEKVKLEEYQKIGLKKTIDNPYFSLLMEQGTGKTPIAIKSLEHRFLNNGVKRVLIIAKSTLLLNWEMELEKFLEIPKKSYVISRFGSESKSKRDTKFNDFIKWDPELLTLRELKQLGYKGKKKDIVSKYQDKVLIMLANYEKALPKVMLRQMGKFRPHMIIIDESHKLKNRNSQAAKGVLKIAKHCDYRIIMTGTPTDGKYEDLFMQYKILDPGILGSSYRDFEDRYTIKGGYMGYNIVGYQNIEELKDIISHHSYRVTLRDKVKLPPITMRYLECSLTKEARKVYNKMDQEMVAYMDLLKDEVPRSHLKSICRDNGIYYKPSEPYKSLMVKASTVTNIASCKLAITKLIRLHQICGGFLTMDSGDVIPLGSEKLDLLESEVMESDTPTVVFCQYVAEIESIKERLSNKTRGPKKLVVESYRDQKTRDKVYKDFRSGKVDVIILQLSSGSEGLNLQLSNKIIFYSWGFSSINYTQAIARIKRRGQSKPMEVIHLLAEDTIDREILDILTQKEKMAKAIL